MRKTIFHLILLVMASGFFLQPGFAKTGYVSDMLLLTFRQGPGDFFDVTKTIQSNTPVKILEEKNGFYQVKLKSGETGWVDKNFITFALPKTIVIEKLKQQNQDLQASLKKIEQEKEAISNSLSKSRKKDDIQTELSEDIKKIAQKNKILEKKLATMKAENKNQFKTDMIKWFLAGFGVLFLGWIIGQSVSLKKDRSGSLLH